MRAGLGQAERVPGRIQAGCGGIKSRRGRNEPPKPGGAARLWEARKALGRESQKGAGKDGERARQGESSRLEKLGELVNEAGPRSSTLAPTRS